MRVFLLAATAALLPQASGAQAPGSAPAQAVELPRLAPVTQCREPTSYKAQSDMVWKHSPLEPKKLTELPSAQGYMAVFRTVNGCEVPMTVTEYRTPRR